MKYIIVRLLDDEAGADATEYALLAALVAVAIIGGAQALGIALGGYFTSTGNTVNTVGQAVGS